MNTRHLQGATLAAACLAKTHCTAWPNWPLTIEDNDDTPHPGMGQELHRRYSISDDFAHIATAGPGQLLLMPPRSKARQHWAGTDPMETLRGS